MAKKNRPPKVTADAVVVKPVPRQPALLVISVVLLLLWLVVLVALAFLA